MKVKKGLLIVFVFCLTIITIAFHELPVRAAAGEVKNNVYCYAAGKVRKNGWYYVNGKIDKAATGVANSVYDNNLYYIKNGKIDRNYTGLARNLTTHKMNYIKSGVFDNTHMGIVISPENHRPYHVTRGLVDRSWKGSVIYKNKHYRISNGRSKLGRKRIFIGDSRTVCMSAAVDGGKIEEKNGWGKNGVYWSAKNHIGLSWMKKTGVPNVEKLIDRNTDIIIQIGVNEVVKDNGAQKTAEYLNAKAAEWKKKGARLYFVSVNPAFPQWKGKIKNSMIVKFNKQIKKELDGYTYIDTYNNVRFESTDGLHYNQATSVRWFNYVMKKISA